jgi:hypothetical protein
MLRDSNGRFMSAAPSIDERNVATAHEEDTLVDKFFAFLYKLVKNGYVVTAMIFLAVVSVVTVSTPGLYEKYGPSLLPAALAKGQPVKEPNLFPAMVYIWTYDSSDQSIQHREANLEGSTSFHGKYQYREGSRNSGVISGYRRIKGGTIGLEYASNELDGNGLGYITLRQVQSDSDRDPPVWIGFETGHDCLCGSKTPHEGKFTSIPAILTTAPEPPEYLVELVKRAKNVEEDFVWPPEVVEKTKRDNRKL